MKSKRLLSLAMAAVMSVSALGYCAAIKAPVGIVASAAVTYENEKKVEMPNVQAKVTYTAEDWKNKKIARAFDATANVGGKDWKLYDSSRKVYTETVYLNKGQLSGWRYKVKDADGNTTESISLTGVTESSDWPVKYGVKFGDIGLKKIDNTPRYTYYGWKLLENVIDFTTDPSATQTKVADSTAADAVRMTSSKYAPLMRSGSDYVAVFQTVVHIAETDEEIMAEIERREKEAAEKAEEDKKNNSKTNYVGRKQGQWNGYDNVINTTNNQKSSLTLYRNTKETAGVVYIPKTGKGLYTASDVKYLFDVCGVTDVEKAFLFDISIPSPYQLIDGKNAVVRLDLPDSEVTDGYTVYVYHIVNGKAKRIRKVGWRFDYVVFAANSFSPYVLVLTPNDQKRGVASTGEVLYANPPTGEGDVVPVAMLAATAIATSCLLTVRKRREQEV